MRQKIDKIKKSEYQQVVAVWEASVRATHDFLKEEDILFFKPLILNTYLEAVELRCIRNTRNEIVGFLGVAEQNLAVTKVDVNEQNEQAVGFYTHCGFEVIGRSELDATGKPYPILHMELKEK